MKKMQLIEALVDREIFSDRREAQSWIMMGRVYVDNERCDKAGTEIPADAEIVVKGLNKKYASRGGRKLEGALSDFGFDVQDKVVVDCGASTGGFTDCLLKHGARRVYAVDVGYGQLLGRLRNDKRVVNLERTNISDLSPADLNPRPELATVDLSYLSLCEAVPTVSRILNGRGDMICLVKPLFEVEDGTLCRRGRIENTQVFVRILHRLIDYFESQDICSVVSVTSSHITGSSGTREFFLWLTHREVNPSAPVQEQIAAAVEEVAAV